VAGKGGRTRIGGGCLSPARVAAAAEVLSARHGKPGDDLRIDVLLLAPGNWPRRIVNASQPGA
jgi:putative endonuclease